MAEAAGLIVGVVALAGTFKDCIDLFAYITASRNLGQDYDLLTTKLDVEKLLLLQWAHRVRLLQPDYDSRLDDPNTYDVISRVLANIQRLLGDGQTLRDRYGVLRIEQPLSTSTTSGVDGYAPAGQDLAISQPRMARLLEDFEALCIRKRLVRKDIPLLHRARWAIHDKEKFERLIGDLSGCISNLDALVPYTGTTFDPMITEDLRALRFNYPHLSSGYSREGDTLIATAADRLAGGNLTRVLDCLWFRVMDDRRIAIQHAHKETFKWALAPHDENTEYKWDDLSHWFEHGSGIYWVSGKAGSGKSTLMKYLYELKKTRDLLASWAGPRPLTIVNFFFYALGSPEQKTQTGLDRALLYQILKAEPSLIPELLPQMWQEALSTSKNTELHPPSPGELRTALAAVKHGFKSTRKLCFFIDGLDEYDGDCFTGASTIRDLANNLDIKIIVSSRPIPLCVHSFKACPTLRLQDLTKRDIARYVNDTVGSHFGLQRLTSLQPDLAQEICHEVASKASGVFLWVVLACWSLIAGLAAYDTVEDLRQRIDELPPELDNLFQHMLQKIEPRYRTQGAKLLRICYHNTLSRRQDLPSIGLAVVEEAGFDLCKALHSPTPPEETRRPKCQILEAKLRSRCCGLLELQIPNGRDGDCFCGARSNPHDQLVDSTVVFIHRTLFEFLSQPDIWDLGCLKPHESLNAATMLSCTNLKLLQIATARSYSTVATRLECDRHLKEILFYANQSDEYAPVKATVHVMSCLEDLLQKALTANPAHLGFWFGTARPIQYPIFTDISITDFPFAAAFAAEMSMANSISTLLIRDKLPKHLSDSFLFHHLSKPMTSRFDMSDHRGVHLHPRTIQQLLSYGCDPNAEYPCQPRHMISAATLTVTTPWNIWLNESRWTSPQSVTVIETTLAFLKAGADVDALGDQKKSSMYVWFFDIANRCPEPSEKQKAKSMVLEIMHRVSDKFNENDMSNPGSPPTISQNGREEQLGSKRRTSANDEGPVKRIRIADILC